MTGTLPLNVANVYAPVGHSGTRVILTAVLDAQFNVISHFLLQVLRSIRLMMVAGF